MSLAVTLLLCLILLGISGCLNRLCHFFGIRPGILCVAVLSLLLLSGSAVSLSRELSFHPASLALCILFFIQALREHVSLAKALLLGLPLSILLYIPGRFILHVAEPGLLLGCGTALSALLFFRAPYAGALACCTIPLFFAGLVTLEELYLIGYTQWNIGGSIQLDAQLCSLCLFFCLRFLLEQRKIKALR